MKVLIGNPESVDDGFGDFSFGYSLEDDKSWEEELKFNNKELMKHINRIILAFKNKGFIVEPKYAYYAWSEYSSSLQAHWIGIKCDDLSNRNDNWIVECASRFLIEYKE